MPMSQTLGIDFALARPNPSAVARAGYRFVMGYLSYNPAKNLTAAQIAAYRAAGLMVGLVWETTADRALSGAPGGASDGAAAEAQANMVGYPAGCVLFAAVDFGASVAQIDGPIRDYMLAFSRATRRPVGVYGSYDVVSRLCTPGRAPVGYAWQTMAWSGSRLWQPGHLFQRLAHTYGIAGAPVTDWDENVLLNPLPLDGATPEVDVQLSDPLSFTGPDGKVQTYTVGDWITWTNYWAQQAVAEAKATDAAVSALAGLVAQGHEDLTKDDILSTVSSAIQAAVVNVKVDVTQPAANPAAPPA